MSRPTICSYYFPNWHVDPRNEVIHGKNWTEWRVTQYATPRFPGHQQPRVPLWGYEDEADPTVMTKKIATAQKYGVDCFVFDWYYFFDGSYRERCIRDGFLGAANTNNLKFAIMWANHDPIYAHPGNYRQPADKLWSGDIDARTFINCTEHLIDNYFTRPNYLRVDGRLYFSIYRAGPFIKQVGGVKVAKLLLDDFRNKVAKAGLGEVMLDTMAYSVIENDDFDQANELIKAVGLDCVSEYSWSYRNEFPSLSYSIWRERNRERAKMISEKICVPHHPVVCVGWDASPRTVQSDMFDKIPYPFGSVITDNTPEEFQRALEDKAAFFNSPDATGQLLHISCWNEWTEGAYLEPDTQYNYGYLEAIKKVFG